MQDLYSFVKSNGAHNRRDTFYQRLLTLYILFDLGIFLI